MDDQIIVIDSIEETQDDKGKRYLKVTDKGGTTRNIKEGRTELLTKKGHLLKEGVAVKLQFGDFKRLDGAVFPFVKDFDLVEGELPAPVTPDIPITPEEQPKPAPQAVGMTTKAIQDMIMAGKLTEIFGVEASIELVKWYRSQILGTTRIKFDGDKLPKW